MSPVEESRTATQPSLSARALQPVRMVVIEGPDRGAEAVLREGTAVIGSLPTCTLVLKDRAVSRQHAQVSLLAGRVRVKDLGSKNGTRYFGAKISTVDAPLGGAIEVGANRVAFLPETVAAGALSERTELAGLVGRSLPMRRLFAQIERLASSDAAVLIRGETGTGKERVATALHALSLRAKGPFRVFDCTSAAGELLPSLLFGHVRGAFTGAVKDSPGALAEADGGTLFLDEIGELPFELQPAFVRALDTGEYTRVGDSKPRKASFRVIAATHQDLEAKVEKGRFHKGLYYRLAAVVVEVPPLRERADDIPLLVEQLVSERNAGKLELDAPTVARLCAYRWPGNVRELRNAVDRALTLGTLEEAPADAPADYHRARELAIKAFERTYLKSLLERSKGSVSAAAREAGLARSYFYELLKAHGIRPKGPGR